MQTRPARFTQHNYGPLVLCSRVVDRLANLSERRGFMGQMNSFDTSEEVVGFWSWCRSSDNRICSGVLTSVGSVFF